MTAILTLRYASSEVKSICTGPGWQVCTDSSVESNLFDGETLDMTKSSGRMDVIGGCR